MPTDLTIIGAGGHAKVVIDVITGNSIGDFSIVDSSPSRVGEIIQNVSVSLLNNSIASPKFHIAIGSNQVRYNLYQKYKLEADFVSLISRSAYLASTAIINKGTFLAAKSVISADSKVGIGCIINHGAIVEHDCVIGEFCHVAPNATILGGVTLGRRVFVGSGATILPGVKIADDVTIGAGALVLSNVLESCTVVGLPAQKI